MGSLPAERELRDHVARAAGALKVFPLPGVVALPGAPTPFHVFEPRYRALTADALAGDRVLAIATLVDPEAAPEDRPPLHPVAGIGVIEAEERLADGRYHVLFRCLGRARLHAEHVNGRPYREFRAELLEDRLPPGGAGALRGPMDALRHLALDLTRVLPEESGAPRLVEAVARLEDPSRLADLVAAAVVQETAPRLRILEALDVGERLRLATDELAAVVLLLSRGKVPSA